MGRARPVFFFSSRRRHTRWPRDWSSDVCSSDLDILKLHEQVVSVLRPGGLFIFDFTTPAHSLQVAGHLNNEEGVSRDHYHFLRTSRYDEQSRIHTNDFNVERLTPDHSTVLETYAEAYHQL